MRRTPESKIGILPIKTKSAYVGLLEGQTPEQSFVGHSESEMDDKIKNASGPLGIIARVVCGLSEAITYV